MKIQLCKFWLFAVTTLVILCPSLGWSQQLVRFDSNFGKFDIELTPNTPLTNANFLTYVDAGSYTNTIIHRSVPDFIVQGGGFRFDDSDEDIEIISENLNPTPDNPGAFIAQTELVLSVDQNPPVLNEPFNSNVRGTVAMAKLGGDPNSATNQWFFNVADNSANLDNQNGGFTAFANVVGDGMEIVDSINSIQPINVTALSGAFTDLPLPNFSGLLSDLPVTIGNFVIFHQIVVVSSALGDLSASGDFDSVDVDLLYAQYGAAAPNDLDFDLDSSGIVDDADRDRLIQQIAGTELGDLNFDGSVDVLGDAFALVANLGAMSGATYAQGDINGDGAVDVLGDAFILVDNLGFTAAGSP